MQLYVDPWTAGTATAIPATVRSLENPTTPLSDPDEWLYEALGAEKAASGVRVGRESSLRYSAWWRGINLISRDVGKLPLFIYRREGGGKTRATEHQAYHLVRYKPNDYQTALIFRQQLTAHALNCGNGYGYIYRRGDGRPLEIVPLNPDQTYALRQNGRLWYVTTVAGEPRKLLPEDVLHIKGLGFDGLTGYSVYAKAREALGVGMAAQQYGARFFRNNARPSVVLIHPARLGEQAKINLRESWNRIHEGLDNSHKTAVLEEAMKVEVIGANARDSQLVELQQFTIREIANFLGVPPHKLGDTAKTSYASLEQENQSYLDDALDFWLANWEHECWDKLLTEAEKQQDSHTVEFLRSALVRADLGARFAAYNTALLGGWLSRDEIRGLENLNPIPDGAGSNYFLPLNMRTTGQAEPQVEGGQVETILQVAQAVVAGQLPIDAARTLLKATFPLLSARQIDGILDPIEDSLEEETAPVQAPAPAAADQQNNLRRALDAILADVVGRMLRRLAVHACRAARKPEDFAAWLETLEEKHGAVIEQALGPVLEARGASSAAGGDPKSLVRRFIAHVRQAAALLPEVTPEAVERLMSQLEDAGWSPPPPEEA
jgi:HK97 family phage portal protein